MTDGPNLNVLFIGNAGGKDGRSALHASRMGGTRLSFADNLFDAEQLLSALDQAVLVIGSRVPLHDATAFMNRLSMSRSDLVGILEAADVAPDLMREALRGGFRDVVAEGSDDIHSAITAAASLIQMNAQSGREAQVGKTGKGPGRLVSFLSPKGGVGKTVLSTNTAVGVAKNGGGRVILLDLNRQFGDVGVFMGISPDVDATDFSSVLDRLDAELLEGLLRRHDSGVDVLLAPSRMDFSQRITEAQMDRLLRVSKGVADYVLVDTPPSLDPNVRVLLDHSDAVFLVATLDVPSVKNTRLMLQTLQSLSYPSHRVKVVLNRANSDVALSPTEVERHLKSPIEVHVPSDGSVPRSVNEGNPLLCQFPAAVGSRFMNKNRRRVAEALMKVVQLTLDVQPSGGGNGATATPSEPSSSATIGAAR